MIHLGLHLAWLWASPKQMDFVMAAYGDYNIYWAVNILNKKYESNI